ncbi:MAG: hypothetical protein ACE5FO_06785 [Parvularculaceae bacterium]
MKRTVIFAALLLAACSDSYEPQTDPRAAVQLAFEGDLENLGWADIAPTPESNKARFRPGPTGKALYPLGDGSWIEYRANEKIILAEKVSISFFFKRADWENPYGPGSATKTIAVVSGKRPDRIQHVSFSISKGDAPHFETYFEDADKNAHRLNAGPGRLSQDWTSVRLEIDRIKGATQLYIDGVFAASVKATPAAIDNGIDILKFGTWHRKNQAYRGFIDNFIIAELNDR